MSEENTAAQTIKQTIQSLHSSLTDYIEATYHISDKTLIKQRKKLLDEDGVIHRTPYLESTPKYQPGSKFSSISGMPQAAQELFGRLSAPEGNLPRLIYDPPYSHQEDSIRLNLIGGKNLVIMTGTGSGKTESFLLPILGRFAREARSKPEAFSGQPAMRALILYPMNALVNDQLGRLRTLFGDPRLVETFKTWCGRPPRFARYTSRTPYAGVRTSNKDSQKLKSFNDFYIDILNQEVSDDASEREHANFLRTALKEHGKWPAKPDLKAWFGAKGERWQDRKTGAFTRAVTLPDDSELLTRHEVQAMPPDLLVTNYSMLEYMLMRPIEQSIFDRTREWLEQNPDENFVVVLDEAHLYRGSAGAEVGLLLRRLRDRLRIPENRISFICATASFNDREYAPDFGGQLSGASADTFVAVTGRLDLKKNAGLGKKQDAEMLSRIDLKRFYEDDANGRIEAVRSLLDYRGIVDDRPVEELLYGALSDYKPMGKLINTTMQQAQPIEDLGSILFSDDVPLETADRAATALMALGSVARPEQNAPGLLPCRIHNFFRGLPGLWICIDPNCSQLPEEQRGQICGKMYSQPMEVCNCGARVLEFFTCRHCGAAHARAYVDDVDSPRMLWADPGARLRMADAETEALLPLDLLLEDPVDEDLAEPADYDLETGQLNPNMLGERTRTVHINQRRLSQIADKEAENKAAFEARGQFKPCAVCGGALTFGRSSVQDHQTKGDQPFRALVTRQIQIQPPEPKEATHFAPLRGRKVLTFSDSRQVAARLAPNLQMYSSRDSLRVLAVMGYDWLSKQKAVKKSLNLNDLYFGVLWASEVLKVRLRPEMHEFENFEAEKIVARAINNESIKDPDELRELLLEIRENRPPKSLLSNILSAVTDKFWGMETLALATLKERDRDKIEIAQLPDIPGLAETEEAKLALARFWLRCWGKDGFWLTSMNDDTWINQKRSEGFSVRPRNPTSRLKAITKIIPDKSAEKIFWREWSPKLVDCFTHPLGEAKKCLNGGKLSLQFEGDWRHCDRCKSVHRPIPGIERCLDCLGGQVRSLNPDDDPVFLARKGFYRKPVMEALQEPPKQPMSLIVAEHTAQLNSPQQEDVFSKAEENELFFQDIDLTGSKLGRRSAAVDILSSTTTMEVGIDIGALSGVALRNMPPGRANYQQRAGRAGRRANAAATVLAFGSADSHDEHYFSKPDEMIKGAVVDPFLTLDNPEITRRHVRAFLLQNYQQERLPAVNPNQPHDLFSALGSVSDFKKPDSPLNREDFETWLSVNEKTLRARINAWLPNQLSEQSRSEILENFISDCLENVEKAIALVSDEKKSGEDSDDDNQETVEVGEEKPHHASHPQKLLDLLLYCGKLPRYAFPTDVAAFHVFDKERSTGFRSVMKFAPSQGLPVALSQYAPDKQVWISGRCYTSGAIYSPMKNGLFNAWSSKKIYMECDVCGFARTFDIGAINLGDNHDCGACGEENSFGPARLWMRPPGFAHPVDMPEETSPEDMPEVSYATRAKLTMDTPGKEDGWIKLNERIRALKARRHLLVSNTGPKHEGYRYCTACGRIESGLTAESVLSGVHKKPHPEAPEKAMCKGKVTPHLVLGADFITDIGLFSLRVKDPLNLKPGRHPANVALRTVSEALAKAACQLLEIESGELMAEYRPALTPKGKDGYEAEVFLYDTLPGGAGFSSQISERGEELFRHALEILKECPGECDSSCYRCLRSFKNKFEHALLDRHVGGELLEYLLTGKRRQFNEERIASSTRLLCSDLSRQYGNKISFEMNTEISYGGGKTLKAPIFIEYKGKKFVVALSGPLTEGFPADPLIDELKSTLEFGYIVIIKNEILVRKNLPEATLRIYEEIIN